jgi:Xaa-Pro aminopeptidase
MAVDAERWAWNKSHLIQSGLDAFICSSPTQVLLLTGYWPVMGASVAFFTADGEVRVIVPEDECEIAGKTTSAKIVPYRPGGLDELVSVTEAVAEPLRLSLNDMGLDRANIGVQLRQGVQPSSYVVGTEYRSSLIERLRQLQPHASFSSCDDLMETMQARKTVVELQIMQKASNIAAVGFAEAERCIQPGARESEVAAAIQAAFEVAGEAESLQRSYGYFFCMSGENSVKAAAAYARTRQRVIEQGDLVMIHANTCADGYWTDITRTFTAGDPSEQQIRMRRTIDEARAAALESIRPGVKGCDVDKAARSVLESNGFGPAFKHATGHLSALLQRMGPRARASIHFHPTFLRRA